MATIGNKIERIISRPAAKPYRSRDITNDDIHLDDDGLLKFGPDDIENPKNWSVKRRWFVTAIAVMLVVNATFASSSPSGCLPSIEQTFHVSREASALVITLFLLGYVAGPLIFAPLSEFYGRRYIFFGTFTAYFAFNFLCAFTPTFAGLLVGRFLTGTFASAPLSNAPGVLADLWGPVDRGTAMALFSVMTFAGPALGPVVSGFFQLKEDWRWSFYVLLWLAFGTLLVMFLIPETLGSQVLSNKARRIRKAKVPGYENVQSPAEASDRTLAGIFKVSLTRPWIILFDPISFLVAIYIGIVYALLYMLFTIYPIVFQEKRGYNAGVGELPLIGTLIGAVIGGVIVFFDSKRAGKRMLAGRDPEPEDRMLLASIGGFLFPITMFWFAWTANFNSIHWIVPTIAGVFLSTSILLIFVSYLGYLTDSYLMYAASAVAANTITRSALGAAAPLFTEQMFSALGVGGAGSLLGGVACLLAPIPLLFWKYGAAIRKRSKFAPTDNKPKPDANQQEDVEKNASSARDRESSEDERALDEEAGIPDPDELAKEMSKDREEYNEAHSDRYLTAHGTEKQEA